MFLQGIFSAEIMKIFFCQAVYLQLVKRYHIILKYGPVGRTFSEDDDLRDAGDVLWFCFSDHDAGLSLSVSLFSHEKDRRMDHRRHPGLLPGFQCRGKDSAGQRMVVQ